MPKKDKRSGFIIFTCQVPWLSGNPKKSSDDDEAARPHEQAREWMAERGTFSKKAPHVGSVEFFQDELSLKEDEIYCFTKGMETVLSIWLLYILVIFAYYNVWGFYTSVNKQHYLILTSFDSQTIDGCYPNKNEISQALGKSNGCII